MKRIVFIVVTLLLFIGIYVFYIDFFTVQSDPELLINIDNQTKIVD